MTTLTPQNTLQQETKCELYKKVKSDLQTKILELKFTKIMTRCDSFAFLLRCCVAIFP